MPSSVVSVKYAVLRGFICYEVPSRCDHLFRVVQFWQVVLKSLSDLAMVEARMPPNENNPGLVGWCVLMEVIHEALTPRMKECMGY
jgi:hypothetical protein